MTDSAARPRDTLPTATHPLSLRVPVHSHRVLLRRSFQSAPPRAARISLHRVHRPRVLPPPAVHRPRRCPSTSSRDGDCNPEEIADGEGSGCGCCGTQGWDSVSPSCDSSQPIRYATGQMNLVESDLVRTASVSDGATSASYGNRTSADGAGVNGAGWLVRQMAYLEFGTGSPGNQIIVQFGAGSSIRFQPNGFGGWETRFRLTGAVASLGCVSGVPARPEKRHAVDLPRQ